MTSASELATRFSERVHGKQETRTCPDCGLVEETVIRTTEGGMRYWALEGHHCPPRVAREEAEKAAAVAERQQWLLTPPARRIAEVRRRVRLPHWAPNGMQHLKPHSSFEASAAKMREHMALWEKGERPVQGLWLVGPTGRRKTCATAALLFDVSHRTDKPCLFWNLENLMEHYRRDVRGQDSDYSAASIENASLLALDDIGTLKFTERAWETLYGIANTATDAWGHSGPRQTVYLTSNESPEELIRALSSPAHPEGGARIVRRLVQLCEVVKL